MSFPITLWICLYFVHSYFYFFHDAISRQHLFLFTRRIIFSLFGFFIKQVFVTMSKLSVSFRVELLSNTTTISRLLGREPWKRSVWISSSSIISIFVNWFTALWQSLRCSTMSLPSLNCSFTNFCIKEALFKTNFCLGAPPCCDCFLAFQLSHQGSFVQSWLPSYNDSSFL